jgi:hypothetical protein
MLFANVTIRLLGSDDFPQEAKNAAGRDLTAAAAQSALSIPIANVIPLAEIATVHELIESGERAGGSSSRFPSFEPHAPGRGLASAFGPGLSSSRKESSQ